MTKEEIIASGLLELYVSGSLSKDELLVVEMAIEQYPSLEKEIEAIETSFIRLSEMVGGKVSSKVWEGIEKNTTNVLPLNTQIRSRNWSSMTGWAAAILFFVGLAFMIKQNTDLKGKLRTINTQNVVLKEKAATSEIRLTEASSLLEIIRSEDYKAISLPGNETVAPNAYATVYYNEKENIAYIDASGLPIPPEGKVYQVWSLVMNPLTPSSIGFLDEFDTSNTLFFKMENVPSPEAFGITLEPDGGSESPTLSQLYTLGMVIP